MVLLCVSVFMFICVWVTILFYLVCVTSRYMKTAILYSRDSMYGKSTTSDQQAAEANSKINLKSRKSQISLKLANSDDNQRATV